MDRNLTYLHRFVRWRPPNRWVHTLYIQTVYSFCSAAITGRVCYSRPGTPLHNSSKWNSPSMQAHFQRWLVLFALFCNNLSIEERTPNFQTDIMTSLNAVNLCGDSRTKSSYKSSHRIVDFNQTCPPYCHLLCTCIAVIFFLSIILVCITLFKNKYDLPVALDIAPCWPLMLASC